MTERTPKVEKDSVRDGYRKDDYGIAGADP